MSEASLKATDRRELMSANEYKQLANNWDTQPYWYQAIPSSVWLFFVSFKTFFLRCSKVGTISYTASPACGYSAKLYFIPSGSAPYQLSFQKGKNMNSPITGKPMKLVREADTLTFRKEKFNVMYHYYLCEDSGERFTDDRLDTLNTVQATNQYREKYGIPFPEEIRQIREQYGVSASKMSEILGMGANTYRLYEAGEMPTVANGRLILSVRDPEEFLKQVQASTHMLSERESEKFIAKANTLIEKAQAPYRGELLQVTLREEPPNSYNGYRRLSLPKVSQAIAYFEQHIGNLYKTKLNKLLFYADFLAYQHYGYSITGLQYRAIQYGPVPAEYERLYLRLQDDSRVIIEERNGKDDQYVEVYHPSVPFDESEFTAEELQIFGSVVRLFARKRTSDIVRLSHEEQAWKDNEGDRHLINYQQYGFEVGANLGLSD